MIRKSLTKKWLVTLGVISIIFSKKLDVNADNLKDGSIYCQTAYESEEEKSNIVSEDNIYVNSKDEIYIDGIIHFDENGKIIESFYGEDFDFNSRLATPANAAITMIHVNSKYNLGWTNIENLEEDAEKIVEDEELNALEVLLKSELENEDFNKITILIDKSYSVEKYVNQVAQILQDVEGVENINIIIFSEINVFVRASEITPDYSEEIGNVSEITNNINEIQKYESEKIILISELSDIFVTNKNSSEKMFELYGIEENLLLKEFVLFVPEKVNIEYSKEAFKEAFPNATIKYHIMD